MIRRLLLIIFALVCAKEQLIDKVKRAAGVFEDNPELVQKYGLDKVVLVTAANHGFLNHFMNFYCFAKKLRMKVLVVSLDEQIDEYLHTHNQSSIISYHMEGQSGQEKIGPASASFRSRQFVLMTARKKAVVLEILKLGYDVVFSDIDVPIVSDPFPYLLWKGIDYVHTLNDPCHRDQSAVWWNFLSNPESEGNTGFYFIRSNPRTIKLFEDLLVAMVKSPELDDQSVFWALMRNRPQSLLHLEGKCRHLEDRSSTNETLVSCVLDPCLFSSGMMRGPARFKSLMETLKERNTEAVTIHANWLNGNQMKQDTLRTYGYWLATDQLGQCSLLKEHKIPPTHPQHHRPPMQHPPQLQQAKQSPQKGG